jgi:hypothetical protein
MQGLSGESGEGSRVTIDRRPAGCGAFCQKPLIGDLQDVVLSDSQHGVKDELLVFYRLVNNTILLPPR